MARALDEAKNEAATVLGNIRTRPPPTSGWPATQCGSADVQLNLDLQILRIHRDAETEDLKQAKELAPSPTCMKIILATNIAESSITFVDVCIVMDFALAKARFKPFFPALPDKFLFA